MGNVCSTGGVSPEQLHALVKKGAADELRQRLPSLPKGEIDGITAGKQRFTLLQRAVAKVQPQCVDIILSQGASVLVRDADNRTLFHLLVSEIDKSTNIANAVAVQTTLLAHLSRAGKVKDVDIPDRDGKTPLLLALANKQEQLALGFLNAGFLPSAVTSNDKSNALHLAIMTGSANLVDAVMQAAERMYKLKDIVNQPNMQGITPLHRTVSMQLLEIFDRLMEVQNLNLNAQDTNGNTPLHCVLLALLSNPKNVALSIMARKFLEKDAAIDMKNRAGQTCFALAVDLAAYVVEGPVDKGSSKLLEPLSLIADGKGKMAVDASGSIFNTIGAKGYGAIHIAAQLGNSSLISGLWNRGADVDLLSQKGRPASVFAAQAGHAKVLVALFGPLGANPLCMDKKGQSALSHLLLFKQNMSKSDMAEVLMAAVNSPNIKGLQELATQPVTQAGTPTLPGELPLLHLACAVGNLDVVTLLITQAHLAPDANSTTHGTPLNTTVAAYCATPGDTKLVAIAEFLVSHGANPLLRSRNGTTPLGRALDEGHLDMAMALIRNAKAQVDFRAPSGATALYVAIVQGNGAVVRELVEALGASTAAQPNFTPLHVAVGCHQPDIVRVLLAKEEVRKAINEQDAHKKSVLGYLWAPWAPDSLASAHARTPLRTASDLNAAQLQVEKLLLQQPELDPNAPDASGKRLLHVAVEHNRVAFIKMLAGLKHRVDPNLADAEGMTPLHRAVQKGDAGIAQAMLNALPALNVNAMSSGASKEDARSALHAAVAAANTAMVELLVNQPSVERDMASFKLCMQLMEKNPAMCDTIMEQLLSPTKASKCSIDLSVPKACTFPTTLPGADTISLPALHYVTIWDKDHLARLFIEHGKANPAGTDDRGLTALHHAVASNAVKVAGVLVSHGADISALGNAPTTPLVAAVSTLDVAMVRALLASTSPYNINATDSVGHTALSTIAQMMLEWVLEPPASTKATLPLSNGNLSGLAGTNPSLNIQPSFGVFANQPSFALPTPTPSGTAKARGFPGQDLKVELNASRVLHYNTSSLQPTSRTPTTPNMFRAESMMSSTDNNLLFGAPLELASPLSAVSRYGNGNGHPPSSTASLPSVSMHRAKDIFHLLVQHGADANHPLPPDAIAMHRQLSASLTTLSASISQHPPATPVGRSLDASFKSPPSNRSPLTRPSLTTISSISSNHSFLSHMHSMGSGGPDLGLELFTPLLLAIQLRAEGLLELLLDVEGLDVNGNASQGNTSYPAVQVALQCVYLLAEELKSYGGPASSNGGPPLVRSSWLGGSKAPKMRPEVTQGANHEEAMQSAMRILVRLIKHHKVDLNVPFEGAVLIHLLLSEMSSKYVQDIASELLRAVNPPNVNFTQPTTGRTALHIAACKNDKAMVEALASAKGVNFNILDNMGYSPLALAVREGARDVLSSLLLLGITNTSAKAPLDPLVCGEDPATSPMALAIAHEEYRVVHTLLAGLQNANNVASTPKPRIAERDAADRRRRSSTDIAALSAVGNGVPATMSKYDIEAVLNTPIDAAGRAPILVAMKAYKLDHAQILVKTAPGAALDVAEPETLSRAGSTGSNSGADREVAKMTPLHFVLEHILQLDAEGKSNKAHKELRTRACVLATDMASAPSMAAAVGMQDSVGFTPLHWAVMAKQEDVVQILCPRARKLDCIDTPADTEKGQHFTALHLAAQLGLTMCAHNLLLHGADLQRATRDGKTALQMAKTDEIRLLLLNPPAVTVLPDRSLQDPHKAIKKQNKIASGYDAVTGQLVYVWSQVKGANTTSMRKASTRQDEKGTIRVADQEAAARAKQASQATFQTFRQLLEAGKVAGNALGPIGGALSMICVVADELLKGVDRLLVNNMFVAHICGRIKRQVPTLQALRKTLETTKNEEAAEQLLPHIANLGEVYIKIHGMVEEWTVTGKAALIARIFSSQDFYDDLLIQERVLTGCMTELGACVNALNLMGGPIVVEKVDPEQAKEDAKVAIRQDMQMAMRDILEAEAASGDVVAAQQATSKLFKSYGLDYNKLKRKERQRWRHDKLKDLIVRVSDLQILGKIGTGGSAQVFRAMYQGHEVAYKQFEALPNMEDLLREGVENEGYIMSTLRHPNIIQVYGIVAEKHQYGLVVDYHPLGSLQNMIENRATSEPISIQARLALALQIAHGMCYLHGRSIEPIVHGDLKPSNVLVSEDGRAVITDFGLACVTTTTTTTTAPHQHNDTFTSNASAVYAAPEVTDLLLHNKKRPPSSDVFSFGVLCLELMTLQPCHAGFAADPLEWSAMIAAKKRPVIPAEFPEDLRQLIDRCWAHEPQDRPCFTAIVEVLDGLYASFCQ